MTSIVCENKLSAVQLIQEVGNDFFLENMHRDFSNYINYNKIAEKHNISVDSAIVNIKKVQVVVDYVNGNQPIMTPIS